LVRNNSNSVVKFDIFFSYDDCGDRADEKGCRASDFGYNVKLAGSAQPHEGRVEVTGEDYVFFIRKNRYYYILK